MSHPVSTPLLPKIGSEGSRLNSPKHSRSKSAIETIFEAQKDALEQATPPRIESPLISLHELFHTPGSEEPTRQRSISPLSPLHAPNKSGSHASSDSFPPPKLPNKSPGSSTVHSRSMSTEDPISAPPLAKEDTLLPKSRNEEGLSPTQNEEKVPSLRTSPLPKDPNRTENPITSAPLADPQLLTQSPGSPTDHSLPVSTENPPSEDQSTSNQGSWFFRLVGWIQGGGQRRNPPVVSLKADEDTSN